VGKIIPELNKKVTSIAFHVSTHTVSIVGLTCYLEKVVKYNDIMEWWSKHPRSQ
jgi:glyceraldehyde 3-phosphate dehydrogenase